VRALIDEIKGQPKKEWKGKKVVVTGILLGPTSFSTSSQFGLAVVADDLARESRQYRTDVPAGADPLYALAKQYQTSGLLARGRLQEGPRRNVMNMAKETGADAIVVCMMKFCDPEEYDSPSTTPSLIKRACATSISRSTRSPTRSNRRERASRALSKCCKLFSLSIHSLPLDLCTIRSPL
jgi:benzoyl-CoA reductase/2-hydroxyglutaryl-CoA dehydratase subunit BcrC/BadD/HgdB